MTLWLSRMWLDGTAKPTREAVTDCHAMHRLIMSGFGPDEGNRSRHGVLYRVEPDRHRATPLLFVQSATRPDWAAVPTHVQKSILDSDPPVVKALDPSFDAGSVWRFRLRANPARKIDTKSGPDGARRNGRRIAIINPEAQRAWLERKASSGGFELVALQITDEPPPPLGRERVILGGGRGRQPLETGEHRPLTFGSVLFDGRLRVTDPDAFRATLAAGIGSGKAFGFGLLSVARVGA